MIFLHNYVAIPTPMYMVESQDKLANHFYILIKRKACINPPPYYKKNLISIVMC